MPHKKLPSFFINAFYESKFKGQLFVIKAGGKIIEDDDALLALLEDIKHLNAHGIRILLIYGGGNAVDEACNTRGIEIKKHEGRRITDASTLNVMAEVIGGNLSLRVQSFMSRCGLDGLSLNAVPYNWMDVDLRPEEGVDYGYVGDIHAVDGRAVMREFSAHDFVAVPCLAFTGDHQLCNINADTIATQLAIGVKAQKLMFLSDVDGVKINNETAFMITAEEIPTLIENGTATGGMRVKLENCLSALNAGVKRIHLINGFRDHALKNEIFESVGPGTMLITEDERENYMTEVEAQKMIEGMR